MSRCTRLLGNAHVIRYFAQCNPEILSEFQKPRDLQKAGCPPEPRDGIVSWERARLPPLCTLLARASFQSQRPRRCDGDHACRDGHLSCPKGRRVGFVRRLKGSPFERLANECLSLASLGVEAIGRSLIRAFL